MDKFTKMTAATLFSLFLAACDKPAEAPASSTQAPVATETTNVQSTQVMDQVGVEDYNKLAEWNKEHEKSIETAQLSLQEQLQSQDEKQIEEALKAFKGTLDEVLVSLDKLDIKHVEVNALKGKLREILVGSSDVMNESVNIMMAPEKVATEEIKQRLQNKTENLQNTVLELQKLEAELSQKFGGASQPQHSQPK
ncbi:hypothetical protein EV693_11613 [Nicoletella semolina]|uniref:Lipoprotein HlpB n=1 Tax=Nicoletella semolina TaxID=271160 RepID=A0A4R2N518_9PAST|nr:lipoprotein HlpB [Nicoletella semolina]MDH2924099.1 hypothetical protein [Nicoletella semolina]TCP15897.1 hypothetical protein EV693_11613 [Nicoletella semolina]